MNNPWYVWVIMFGTLMLIAWAIWMKTNGFTIG